MPIVVLAAVTAAMINCGVAYWFLYESPARSAFLGAALSLSAAIGCCVLAVLATDLFGTPALMVRVAAVVFATATLSIAGMFGAQGWKRHRITAAVEESRAPKRKSRFWN